MNSTSKSAANRVLGVLLVLFSVWSINSSMVHQYYTAHGLNIAGLYVSNGLRVLAALVLILGRGQRLMLALRLGEHNGLGWRCLEHSRWRTVRWKRCAVPSATRR